MTLPHQHHHPTGPVFGHPPHQHQPVILYRYPLAIPSCPFVYVGIRPNLFSLAFWTSDCLASNITRRH